MRQVRKFSTTCFVSLGAMMLLAVLSASPAWAFQFATGNPDLRISWDNTIKYSTAFRVEGRSDKLTDIHATTAIQIRTTGTGTLAAG